MDIGYGYSSLCGYQGIINPMALTFVGSSPAGRRTAAGSATQWRPTRQEGLSLRPGSAAPAAAQTYPSAPTSPSKPDTHQPKAGQLILFSCSR